MKTAVYLNARCKEILQLLTAAGRHLTVDEIAKAKMVSRRSIYYDLCKINEWLEYHGIVPIEVERGKGICLTAAQNNGIASLTDRPEELGGYVFSPGERARGIICLIGLSLEVIRIEDLMHYCQVSRNTIFNDLKVASAQLARYDLKLVYETKKGYRIEGDAVRVRTVCLHYMYSMISLYASGVLRFQSREKVQEEMEKLRAVEYRLNTSFPEEMVMALSALLPLMEQGREILDLRDVRIRDVVNTREFAAVAEYFPELVESEQIYLSLHLLGNRIQMGTGSRDADLYTAARSVAAEFEKASGITFSSAEEVERALFMHLKSSWYRLRYGILMDGAILIEELVRRDEELYEGTKKACAYLEDELALPIPESEVAYMALNFAGYLKRSSSLERQLRILIVCCQGMTTGHMLRWEIGTLLPKARVVGVVAHQDVFYVKDVCDLVLSTVPVHSDVPVEVVHPMMTDKERIAVLRRSAELMGMAQAGRADVSAAGIMEIVGKYVPREEQPGLMQKLEDYLKGGRTDGAALAGISARRGLLTYLTQDKICLTDGELSWREALGLVASPLLQAGSIEPSYVERMISVTETMGTYMFFVPWLVLAHASPESGVNRLDVSMGVFRKPVQFSRYRKAKIIIMLAPVDKESHLEIVRDLMRIFAVQTRIDELQHQDSPAQILERLKEY